MLPAMRKLTAEVALVSLATVLFCLAPLKASSNADLLLDGHMEVKQFSDLASAGFRASGNTPTISNGYTRAGKGSMQVFLDRKNSGTSYRTEATTEKNQLGFFERHWIGFSIFVPSDWEPSNTWEVLFQLHDHPKDWSIALNPIFAIGVDAGSNQWQITQRYLQVPEASHTKSDQRTAFREEFGPIARGKWTDFVVEYRPDWRSNSDGGAGLTKIWRNGTLLKDYRGPNAYNQANSPYIKFGVYKSAWKNRSLNDPVLRRTYYFDEVRVSKPGRGNYELVDPARSASNVSASPPLPPGTLTVR
jgi:hypothetical protein